MSKSIKNLIFISTLHNLTCHGSKSWKNIIKIPSGFNTKKLVFIYTYNFLFIFIYFFFIFTESIQSLPLHCKQQLIQCCNSPVAFCIVSCNLMMVGLAEVFPSFRCWSILSALSVWGILVNEMMNGAWFTHLLLFFLWSCRFSFNILIRNAKLTTYLGKKKQT